LENADMDLSIIIVSFNTRELTIQCVQSILNNLDGKVNFEIIVVDNDSRDGTQRALKTLHMERRNLYLSEESSNLGFAKANNIGIRRARGKYVLLLNSDTYFVDDSVLQTLGYLDENADVFGCGCSLLNADGSVGISYGAFPELGIVCAELITGRFGNLRAAVPGNTGAICPIDFPCGAFFLIKRNLLDTVGLLDEGFFMYCEETDLAKRAWKAGYSVVYYGPAKVVHLRGQSASSDRRNAAAADNAVDLKKTFYQSWKRYLTKHRSPIEVMLVGFLLSLYFKTYEGMFSLMRNREAEMRYHQELKALHGGWSAPMEPISTV